MDLLSRVIGHITDIVHRRGGTLLEFIGETTVVQKGKQKNQFYYVAACDGSTIEDMPFAIIGTHYHWRTYPVSGIDYFTIELYDNNSKEDVYFVYLSYLLHFYAKKSSLSSPDFDATKKNHDADP